MDQLCFSVEQYVYHVTTPGRRNQIRAVLCQYIMPGSIFSVLRDILTHNIRATAVDERLNAVFFASTWMCKVLGV